MRRQNLQVIWNLLLTAGLVAAAALQPQPACGWPLPGQQASSANDSPSDRADDEKKQDSEGERAAPPRRVSEPDPKLQDDPRFGLLNPIPETGGVPPIYSHLHGVDVEQQRQNAKAREFRGKLRRIQREYFNRVRSQAVRRAGMAELATFTDPAAFQPMLEVFAEEKDDVRLFILDHLAEQDDAGEAALGWAAIHHADPAIRNEALLRIDQPAGEPLKAVIDQGLRDKRHEIVNNAALVAGAANVLDAIPLLIFSQATQDQAENEGDLAWIAIQTQTAYVANVRPVVGGGSGAFEPVIGIVNEGTVLRVMDAVVVVYRTEVHQVLVNMTTEDWGKSTEHLGYNMPEWWAWYNKTYVPYKNAQLQQQDS